MKLISKYKVEILLWLAMFSMVVGKLSIWDANKVVGTFEGIKYTEASRAYFLGVDMVVLFMSLAIGVSSNKIVSWIFVALSVGKVLDEFTNPFSIGIAELVTILISAIYLFYQLIISIKNGRD